jgi:tetratricopeptide (TPR) repeat protein
MNFFKLFKRHTYHLSVEDKLNINKGFSDLLKRYELNNFDLYNVNACMKRLLELATIKNPIETADLYNDIGNRYSSHFQKYKLAINYYKKAIEFFDTLLEYSNLATYHNLAQCYFVEKNYDECIELSTKALTLSKRKFGEKSKENIEILSLIGDAFLHTKNYNLATENYSKVIQLINSNEYSEKFEDLVYYTSMIGKSFYMNNQYTESLKFYTEAKEIIEKYKEGYSHKATIENSIDQIKQKFVKSS